MSCPICGANCRCKKRGAGGICCSCHRHKVKQIIVTRDSLDGEALRQSYDRHIEWFNRDVPENRQLQCAEGHLFESKETVVE